MKFNSNAADTEEGKGRGKKNKNPHRTEATETNQKLFKQYEKHTQHFS